MNLEQRLRASAKRFIAELDAALEEHQDFLRQRDQKMATSAPVGAFGRKPISRHKNFKNINQKEPK